MLTLTLPGGGPAWTHDDVLHEIDRRYQAGLIDEGERHLFRVEAIKDPDLLPEDLRALSAVADPSPRRSATAVFSDAWKWIVVNGAEGGTLHNLLLPPEDLPNVLDSATWPIRVSYDSPSDEFMAQAVLAAAETSWEVEINQFGFYEPPIEPGTERYRFYISPTNGNGAAYTSPYDQNPDTTWSDCFTYIVVDPASSWNVESTTAHEVNHSMQAAMDCLEARAFWENTATYIQGQVYPDQMTYTLMTIRYFQEQPWKALSYMNVFDSDLYEYGGSLFVWYLADTYAPDDGPQLVADIWESSIQDGTVNEPDYLEAIEDVVAARGQPDTIEDVLVEFSEARYFLGRYNDGAHMSVAGTLWGSEVTLTDWRDPSDLPVVQAQVNEDRRPAPFGSNHIRLDLPASYPHPLRVVFDGDDDTRWTTRVFLIGDGPAQSGDLVLDPQTWDGTLVVEPGGAESLLLLVVNRGDGTFDPDDNVSGPSGYTYSFEPVLEAPTLAGVTPNVVERGTQGLTLVLTGTGFAQGPEFGVTFDDEALQVAQGPGLHPTQVTLTVTIPLFTELGPKTVTLTNGDGQQVVGVDFLTVVEHGSLVDGDAGTGGAEPRTGCGCAAGADGTSLLFAFLLGLLGLVVARRRRRP